MKNILKIYKRDLKSIVKNPVALIIVAGICLLPSLYAWVNIKACWNPYNNTSGIPVAVVNQDEGTAYNGKNINIGRDVVNKLKTNKQIGWNFVDEKEADLGVADGTYFAVIEIPKNFSSSFVSVLSGNTKKPEIIYKVDTKDNPVASKITDAAKDSLVDQISTNFISAVNETLFTSLNEVGQDAEKNKYNIIKLKNDIIAVNNNMDLILSMLNDINSRSQNLSSFLIEMKATMPAVDSELSTIAGVNNSNENMIKSTQATLNESFDNIDSDLNSAQATVNRIHDLVNNLNSSTSSTMTVQANEIIAQINNEIDSLNDEINSIINYLQVINDSSPNADIANIIASLESIQSSLADEKSKVNTLQQQLNSANSINTNLVSQINNDTTNLNLKLINTALEYNSTAKKDLNTIADNMITATEDASALISSAQGLEKQIDSLMSTSINGSQVATKVSGDLIYRLNEYKDIISSLSEKLQDVNNNDLAQIITILQSNPKFMGNYVSDPFNLDEESIYGVPNYGSAMAPVYSVLALWVGTLILTSILKTEVAPFKGSKNFTLREKYFGKMLFFVTLAAIQGLIVSTGDKLLLGVYTVNAPLMIIFAVVSSIIFSIITYTLVSLLGNVGKALAIIYMILQLAGSGGTYPIQVDPLIFRILQPTFPFTYAIGGFREAIAGPIISSVFLDFTMLIIIAIIFLLLGFFLKKPLYGHVQRFEIKFKQSGLGE